MNNSFNIYHFIFVLFVTPFCSHGLEEQQAAFVQTGDELHYFVDANQLADSQYSPSSNFVKSANHAVDESVEATPALNQLKFEPAKLVYREHAVGVPHLRKVRVDNPTASAVRFDAISGSTVHFHCSFFEHKTVDAGGWTTFDVVFLPRAVGLIQNVLLIHSSLGSYEFRIEGTGVANPYRLRPYVGAKIPLNGSFVSTLEMHNPHAKTLRVTEMYTSGGDLHLELPQMPGVNGASMALWEIPPFQTRTVMQARLVASREKNATAYIRIKTDLEGSTSRPGGFKAHVTQRAETVLKDIPSIQHIITDEAEQSVFTSADIPAMVLPIEVEVSSKPGLYSTVDVLDFGMLKNAETSRSVPLQIVSTLNKAIEIESVTIEPANDAISVTMESVAIKPPADAKRCITIAKLSYMSHKIEGKPTPNQLNGKVVVKSKAGEYKLYVPYAANVLHGKLMHDLQDTAFYAGRAPPFKKRVSLTNTFAFPVAIYNISLPRVARNVFLVENFSPPVIVRPSMLIGSPVFTLQLTDRVPPPFTSFCRLYTNISKIDIPIHVFNGMIRVTLYSIDADKFDFGSIDSGESRSIHFALTNENPVPIVLRQFRPFPETFATLQLLGVEHGNETVLARVHNVTREYSWKMGLDFSVPAHNFAVFKLSVVAPAKKGLYQSKMTFSTSFQTLVYPVSLRVESGALVSIPERLTFVDAFPGRISSQPLQVYSTFGRDMPLLRLSTLSHDPRIFFESFDSTSPPPIIKHGQMSFLGRVFFFPIAGCMDDCYVGMPLNTNDGAWFVYGMRLPPNLPEIDAYLYQKLRRKWTAMEKSNEHIVNSTIVIDSTDVQHYQVPAEGRLVWPRLMKQSSVTFPLTAVGNYTIINLTLHNPSSLPVVVQLLPLTIYPDPETLLHLFKDEMPSPLTDLVEMNETLMFTLRDTELFNLRPDSPVPKFRRQLEEMLKIQVPRFTLSMSLQPGMKVRVRVGFLPSDYQLRSSLLLIRNNLTVLEPVVLYGRGAKIDMRMDGKMARNFADPLKLEIQSHHVRDCENPKRLTHKLLSTLTVRKPFNISNNGEVSLTVTNISVSGLPCANRGFGILNCQPFVLKPNETHVLDVAYTPDFGSSLNEAHVQLYVHGNGTPFSFKIAATLPADWLAKCQTALPRPPWESLMYYVCVIALIFLLICVIATAYLEGDQVITVAMREHFGIKFTTFDFKNLDKKDTNNTVNNQSVSSTTTSKTETAVPLWQYCVNAVPSMISGLVKKTVAPPVAETTKHKEQQENEKKQKDKEKLPVKSVASNSHVTNKSEVSRKNSSDEGASSKKKKVLPTPSPAPVITKIEESIEVSKPPAKIVQENEIVIVEQPEIKPIFVEKKARKKRAGSKSDVESSIPSYLSVANVKKSGKRHGKENVLSDGSGSDAAMSSVRRVEALHKLSNDLSRVEEMPVTNGIESPPAVISEFEAVKPVASLPYASESDESCVPEWETSSIATELSNFDDAFADLSKQTQSFAAGTLKKEKGSRQTTRNMHVTSADSSSCSTRSSSRDAYSSSSPSPPMQQIRCKKPKSNSSSSSYTSGGPALLSSLPRQQQRRLPPKSPARIRKEMKAAVTQSIAAPLPLAPKSLKLLPPQPPTIPHGSPTTPDVGIIGHPTGLLGQPTMMQQLRAERQRRLKQYLDTKAAQHNAEEPWPGLASLPTLTESLWDEGDEPWKTSIIDNQVGCSLWGAGPGGDMDRPLSLAAALQQTTGIALPTQHEAAVEDMSPLEPPPGLESMVSSASSSMNRQSKFENSGDAAGFNSPLFKLNPAARPFVSAAEKARQHTSNPNSSDSSHSSPPPNNLPPQSLGMDDPGIIAWAPPAQSRAFDMGVEIVGAPPSPSLTLGGSLFSAGSASIWDPLCPVNPEQSWNDIIGQSVAQPVAEDQPIAQNQKKKEIVPKEARSKIAKQSSKGKPAKKSPKKKAV